MIDPEKLHKLREIVDALDRFARSSAATKKQTEHAREVDSLKLAEELADRAGSVDASCLLVELISEATASRVALISRIAAIESGRQNVLARREEFAATVHDDRWKFAPGDRTDRFGPLELAHAPPSCVVRFAGIRLYSLNYPSGLEVANCACAARGELEDAAPKLKDSILSHLRARREKGHKSTWELLQDAHLDAKGRRPAGIALAKVAYALMQLLNDRMVDSQPPALAEQKEAISLPDLIPGKSRRVHVVTLPPGSSP